MGNTGKINPYIWAYKFFPIFSLKRFLGFPFRVYSPSPERFLSWCFRFPQLVLSVSLAGLQDSLAGLQVYNPFCLFLLFQGNFFWFFILQRFLRGNIPKQYLQVKISPFLLHTFAFIVLGVMYRADFFVSKIFSRLYITASRRRHKVYSRLCFYWSLVFSQG